jgi:hypothetical protein
MGESQHPDPGSGMNNPDHIFLELRNHCFAFFGVKILKFFDEDPGSGIRDGDSSDPGWRQFGSGIRDGKKSDPGSGIRDKHPGSATLPAALVPPLVIFFTVSFFCNNNFVQQQRPLSQSVFWIRGILRRRRIPLILLFFCLLMEAMLRIRDVYPGSLCFSIPDPESKNNTKRGGEKKIFLPILEATNIIKL